MLILEDVCRTYRNGPGVHHLDLRVSAGQIVALVGLNGAGKTTLMRLALGMLRPDRGTAYLFGRPLRQLPASQLARLGALVEAPLAYPELTVLQNLRLVALLRGTGTHRIAQTLDYWELTALAARRFRRLSSGNRQRVGLAAALGHDPDLIVLDEPSAALDPAGVISLRETLRRRAGAGAGVLVSSHHLDEVARIADRIVVMNAGRLITDLDPAATDLERVFFESVRRDDEQRRSSPRAPGSHRPGHGASGEESR